MSQDAQLFKTPSIEIHLLSSTSLELDKALEVRNEEGGFPTEPEPLAELARELVERFTVRQGPRVDDPAMTFHNDRNQLLTLMVPVVGNIYFLTYQARSMPAPAFVGLVHMEGEAGTIAVTYKLTKDWERSLDGDMALLKTYIGAINTAIGQFNAALPALIEGKIKDTLTHNQLRRDIAEKLAKRGFREI
ncbi:MAG: hypothetical protein JWM80_5680 [Cyanobacteria bacterium RYN_339]|nr:hypothetical protein [Cyanobacteria bacterium RYN_339]